MACVLLLVSLVEKLTIIFLSLKFYQKKKLTTQQPHPKTETNGWIKERNNIFIQKCCHSVCRNFHVRCVPHKHHWLHSDIYLSQFLLMLFYGRRKERFAAQH